jgi:pimeloyl-ACP methyl ester carboxylesterase
MKKALLIPLAALAIAGCSSLEKALLNSNLGKDALYAVDRYMTNYGKSAVIEDYGLAEKKDESPQKPILFFIHGWASSLEEWAYEEKGSSRLDIMNEVFDNRVIAADYSSCKGIEDIFSELDSSFTEFMDEYAKNNEGDKPKLIIAGQSMGTQLARLFSRRHPEYFKKVGLIAGVSQGFNLGPLPVKKMIPKYISKIAKKDLAPEEYQSIIDLMPKSDFFKELNTPTNYLDIEYNFYVFSSKKDSPFIKGEDDRITSVSSAYPLELIETNRFEDVKFGDVIIYEGAVDHSLYNQDILREILQFLKSDKPQYKKAPSLKEAKHITVPEFTQQEAEKRERERQFKKGMKY